MAYEPNPGDFGRSNKEPRGAARLDSELQPDPELAEGPAGRTRIVIFAVAIAVIVGAVLYGLNQAPDQPSGASSVAQKTQSAPVPTPTTGSNQGTTTGTAPAQPQQPPSSAPAGQDINPNGNPPNSAPKK